VFSRDTLQRKIFFFELVQKKIDALEPI